MHLRRSNPRLLLALAGLTAAGVGAWQFARRADARDSSRIVANGTIEAEDVEIGAQRPARLARYLVEEGQWVHAGEVVAVLDTSELKAALLQSRGAAESAAQRLAELRHGTRPEELARSAALVEQARAGVSGAQRTLLNARKSFSRRTALKQALDSAVSQRDASRAAVRQAESALAGAEQAVKTAGEERATSITLRGQRDAAREALNAALAAERSARAKLDETLRGPRPEVLRAQEAVLGQAAAAVRQAAEEARNAAEDLRRTRIEFEGRAASQQKLDVAQTHAGKSESALRQAQQAQAQAEARLTELRNGSRPEEIEQARAAAEQAGANVEGSRKAYENAQQAYELRLGARAQLEATATQRQVAEAQLSGARAQLAGAELAVGNARIAYTDALGEKQGVDTALTQYESAIGQLQAADAQLQELRNGATAEQLAQARGQAAQARGSLELAQAQYEQSVIRAPRAGVLSVHVARVGEVVQPGATVAKLVPLEDVYLTLYVPLPELGKVKLGQAVEITTDTYPKKIYPGTVSRISETPEFTPRNVQTQDERVKLVFQVRVNVDNRRHELKPGMPADATIRLR